MKDNYELPDGFTLLPTIKDGRHSDSDLVCSKQPRLSHVSAQCSHSLQHNLMSLIETNAFEIPFMRCSRENLPLFYISVKVLAQVESKMKPKRAVLPSPMNYFGIKLGDLPFN